jgi:hypothetical protein
MSSARNHAQRSHRSHHDVRQNTSYSTRRTIVRSYTKPRRQSSFFARLLAKMTRQSYGEEVRREP